MTYSIGDHVERNPSMVPVAQLAEWHREYPGGRRGVVVGIDTQFDATPYCVEWADGATVFYRAADLLPATVPAAQASLFEGAV